VIIDFVFGVLKSSYILLMEMAPYLLFGFLSAGILREFISTEQIARHLGKNSFGSVVKAALFGIPLPLCSCGVIPPTMTLRNAGASRGSVLSFLIATPTTGMDSIFATYSLLGPVFAVYRVVASFFAGIFSGIAVNLFDRGSADAVPLPQPQAAVSGTKPGLLTRIYKILHYAFVELLSDIGKWLLIGIVIGGLITWLIPPDFFQSTFTSRWQAILLILLVSIPLYVCATGSIPIAAALMMKGLNPGAAFVLLLAGPATNAVTITVISRYLGKKTTLIYLSTLIISSMGFGFLLDFIWNRFDLAFSFHHHHHHQMLPGWVNTTAALFLTVMLTFVLVKRFISERQKRIEASNMQVNDKSTDLLVPGMTCNNCVTHVKNALVKLAGVESVTIDLSSKLVRVQHTGSIGKQELALAVENSGYKVTNK